MSINTSKYTRRPFDIDAIQVTEENISDVASWCKGTIETESPIAKEDGKHILVRVLRPVNSRQTTAFVGDWVLKYGKTFKVYTNEAFGANFIKSTEFVRTATIIDPMVPTFEEQRVVKTLRRAFDLQFVTRLQDPKTRDLMHELVEIIMDSGTTVVSNPFADMETAAKNNCDELIDKLTEAIMFLE